LPGALRRLGAKHGQKRMKTQILKDDVSLREFAERFQQRGNPVSLEYLRRCQVRAFYDSAGRMFAGYALNQSRPLRYVEWIPEAERARVSVKSSEARIAELTCIWIYGRQGRISSELVYLHSVVDALLCGADYVLGGTLSAVVYGIQSQSIPELLYSGPTDYFGKPKRCWVYGASRWVLAKQLVKVFPAALARGLVGKPTYLGVARRRARQAVSSTSPGR
jgi:hypothetical protein